MFRGKAKPPILWIGGEVLKYERLVYVCKDSKNKYSYKIYFIFLASQFEIVGCANHGTDNKYDLCKPTIKGKLIYKRLLIKKK